MLVGTALLGSIKLRFQILDLALGPPDFLKGRRVVPLPSLQGS